ncbi:MAG: four helix bundle protein [bacterium]|nr:four helix bundle protein [bacterium]
MNSYKELIVWQKSIELVVEVYKLTDLYPKGELYGLTSQTCRAAVSIPSNIAEGYTRKHRKEYAQFIRIAFSSGAELETQIIIAKKLGYASESIFNRVDAILLEVMKMLNRLDSKLQN